MFALCVAEQILGDGWPHDGGAPCDEEHVPLYRVWGAHRDRLLPNANKRSIADGENYAQRDFLSCSRDEEEEEEEDWRGKYIIHLYVLFNNVTRS